MPRGRTKRKYDRKKKSTDENNDSDDETFDEENGEDFMTQLSESFMSSFSYPVTMISSMFDDDDDDENKEHFRIS